MLQGEELKWYIKRPWDGHPTIDNLTAGRMNSILPNTQMIIEDGALFVIAHPEYNGVLSSFNEIRRVFGDSLWYSLLHAICTDFCCQWDSLETTPSLLVDVHTQHKSVWITTIQFLLHSHILGYLRAINGTTSVTLGYKWKDGNIGELRTSTGIFQFHEFVMDKIHNSMTKDNRVTESQALYRSDPDGNDGLFEHILRAIILEAEQSIDKMMNNKFIISRHVSSEEQIKVKIKNTGKEESM